MAAFQKTGDWKKIERMLSGLGDRFKSQVKKATDKNGKLLEGAIVKRIEDQKMSGPELSPAYLAAKVRQGYSEKKLIRTGTLMGNIRYQSVNWDQGVVTVLRREPKHGYDIGWIMEFGSRDGRVPPRPFVRPSLQECAPKMVTNYEDAVERAFKK